MRPYILGEDMTGISVTDGDILREGGMIAKTKTTRMINGILLKSFPKKNYDLI